MDAAKPWFQSEKHHKQAPWNDAFTRTEERPSAVSSPASSPTRSHQHKKLTKGVNRIFLSIHWLCSNQTFNNTISQAGEMVNDVVLNDAIRSLNPVSWQRRNIVVPIIQKGYHPHLTRWRVRFGPIAGTAIGSAILAIALAHTAGLRQMAYNTGPSCSGPLVYVASNNGEALNQVFLFLQAPTPRAWRHCGSILAYHRHKIHLQPSAGEHEVGHSIHLFSSG